MKHLIKITLLFSLFIVLNFSSCKDEDNPPVDVLTLTADFLYYNLSNVSEWVVIWNSDGDILDYQPYVHGSTQKFTTTGKIVDNKITIGFVSAFSNDGRVDISTHVYTDVPVGRVLNITRLSDPFPAIGGEASEFTVNVDPTHDFTTMTITNKYGVFSGINGDQTSMPVVLDPRSNHYNVMSRSGETVTHKLLDNVEPNAVVELAEEDFTPYENQFTIDIPSAWPLFLFEGYPEGIPLSTSGFNLDSYFGDKFTDHITTGYPNGLEKFAMVIQLSTPPDYTKSISFEKWGYLPGAINWPDKTQFNISGKDPLSFGVTAPGRVNFIKAVWQSYNTQYAVRWEVISAQTTFKLGTIPDELLEKYPYIAPVIDGFESVDIHVGPATYEQVLKRELDWIRTDEFESVSVSVR